jgi:hypothetical protein
MDADSTTIPSGDRLVDSPLVLVESATGWVLTRRLDSRFEIGSCFEHHGEVWTVIWDSDHGFVDHTN